METDRADQHLTADLEPTLVPAWRKALRWIGALVESLFGSMPSDPDLDLVVRRIDTGAEVLRTHADLGDPERLLETVRDDLRTKSVTDFVAEWRVL